MISQPLVSICIPTYNADNTIRETLASILCQTYSNFRVHVVDNNSTDNTLAIVESFNDSRVCIHRNREYIPTGEGNFNRCIQIADGKYTAIYHADDLYKCDMVETQVKFLEKYPDAACVFSSAEMINEHGKNIGQINFPSGLGSLDRVYNFEEILKAILKYGNFLICSSVMAITDVYKYETKGWQYELYKTSSDLGLWLEILRKHPVGLLNVHLMKYRISHSQGSALVRASTEPAAFFLVMEQILADQKVARLLDKVDIEHYHVLKNWDLINRATNYFLEGKIDKASIIVDKVFMSPIMRPSFQSKKSLYVFASAYFLKVLLAFQLKSLGKLILMIIKKIMNK